MYSSILTQENWPVSKEELLTVDHSACLIESELKVYLESSLCVSSLQESRGISAWVPTYP